MKYQVSSEAISIINNGPHYYILCKSEWNVVYAPVMTVGLDALIYIVEEAVLICI
jgi:hypothetical protein